ncbi:MAG: type VI secretion system baseplate subunit TssG [Acidobacteria bacterium]|nr:type VI secretion system baseplate subunit TssG [Acidobacteriota bacterium]
MAAEIGPQDSPLDPDTPAADTNAFSESSPVLLEVVPDGDVPRFAAVADLLRAEPWSFDFFRAVWLLEQLREGRRRVGMFNEPSREVVRFTAHPSLSFPASSIQSLAHDSPLWRMAVNFMGLTGPFGVLPRHYTAVIQERARMKDFAFRDFTDLFNHRAVSLFYRAWTKYRLPIRYARGADDQLTQAFLSLSGLGTPHLTGRQEVNDETFVWYSGLFGMQARSAVALEQILEDYFQVPVEVMQFVGAWCRLETSSTTELDEDEDPSEQLGLGAVVGDEVYDHQARARVRMGPLTFAQYRRMLPGGADYRRVRELTRLFSRDQIDFELQLVLKRGEVPPAMLEPEPEPVMLGWTSWVKTQPEFPRDPEDTVLLLQ